VRGERKYETGHYAIEDKRWFRAWNRPWNPFGNWHEPMPWPPSRREQAPKAEFLAVLGLQFYRNPMHNLTHFWIGITPVGERYEWITPDKDDWEREIESPTKACWVRGNKRRCRRYWYFWGMEAYFGWLRRGSFGMALRRQR